ncbi:V-type ATP synthase subunit F [Desulfurobacterium atlanticum]|uniref:V/A-type H+-transporting ATPase subunit F n=1 Tax=Desulfurobacterium atlanticum TaxID=240169 RepID=A0A238XU27_9BACT|nr:V-type ATP synthase subunit F [Desulfurobacterium atlanticum]SNR61509.1 V/A-type H+-transporting ATPase subunit F [Desulfurobacterium atlanticum]
MRMVFVGTDDECTGFGLAGVETVVVETEREFQQEMLKLLKEPSVAVIVVSEKFVDFFNKSLKEKLGKKALPAVVFVPSFEGVTSKQSLKEFLASVLGIRLQ